MVLLDDSSPSFCHYSNHKSPKRLISADSLKKGILFGMKNNLNIQFVYPDYQIPSEYQRIIDTVLHSSIIPFRSPQEEDADVVILDGLDFNESDLHNNGTYVIRLDNNELSKHLEKISSILSKILRLNLIITDVLDFGETDYSRYEASLSHLAQAIIRHFQDGYRPQLNLLTDRIFLSEMNNCGAGHTTVTLAPNGCFYVCPAYYYDKLQPFSIGSPDDGLTIRNRYLYDINHAPICRQCDSFHCKRCIWFNEVSCHEVNTPSHEQCVVSHIERETSRMLLEKLQEMNFVDSTLSIREIDYLDPFEKYILK